MGSMHRRFGVLPDRLMGVHLPYWSKFIYLVWLDNNFTAARSLALPPVPAQVTNSKLKEWNA